LIDASHRPDAPSGPAAAFPLEMQRNPQRRPLAHLVLAHAAVWVAAANAGGWTTGAGSE